MKVVKKILSIIGDVLIGLIFVVSVVLVISTINKKKSQVPSAFGYIVRSVQTNSMQDKFEAGDLIICKVQEEGHQYQIGDIVTFWSQIDGTKTLITHQIVAYATNGYITQGTNRAICTDVDSGYRTNDDIVGVYQFKIDKLGLVVDFLKEPLGFVLCVILPFAAYILYQVYKIIKMYVAAKEQEMLEKQKEDTSAEVKDAIIKEYLAKLEAEKKNQSEQKGESD